MLPGYSWAASVGPLVSLALSWVSQNWLSRETWRGEGGLNSPKVIHVLMWSDDFPLSGVVGRWAMESGATRLVVEVGAATVVAVVCHPDGSWRPVEVDGSNAVPAGVVVRGDGRLVAG